VRDGLVTPVPSTPIACPSDPRRMKTASDGVGIDAQGTASDGGADGGRARRARAMHAAIRVAAGPCRDCRLDLRSRAEVFARGCRTDVWAVEDVELLRAAVRIADPRILSWWTETDLRSDSLHQSDAPLGLTWCCWYTVKHSKPRRCFQCLEAPRHFGPPSQKTIPEPVGVTRPRHFRMPWATGMAYLTSVTWIAAVQSLDLRSSRPQRRGC